MATPTPQDHVRHFLSTVEDLERLSVSFPVSASINIFGHREDDEARWRVIMHALLLRKYFQEHDDLNLSKVARSVRLCSVTDKLTSDEWKDLEENVAELGNSTTAIYGDDTQPYDEGQILKNELYGRFLHGDFGKWQHTQRVGNRADNQVLMATLSRLHRVQRFTEFVRQGIREGLLDISQSANMDDSGERHNF